MTTVRIGPGITAFALLGKFIVPGLAPAALQS
jgi:hypothetical protein